MFARFFCKLYDMMDSGVILAHSTLGTLVAFSIFETLAVLVFAVSFESFMTIWKTVH